jgi:predicted nucleic acid-binding protein
MNEVFVDSDVVLDLYIDREPHHHEALLLFTHLKRSGIKCFCSPIVIANAYYILSKVRNSKYALDKIGNLRKLVSVATVGQDIIDLSIKDPHKDFEDSIQFHCAIMNGIKTIITRNTKHYPKDQISVMHPNEYMTASGSWPKRD